MVVYTKKQLIDIARDGARKLTQAPHEHFWPKGGGLPTQFNGEIETLYMAWVNAPEYNSMAQSKVAERLASALRHWANHAESCLLEETHPEVMDARQEDQLEQLRTCVIDYARHWRNKYEKHRLEHEGLTFVQALNNLEEFEKEIRCNTQAQKYRALLDTSSSLSLDDENDRAELALRLAIAFPLEDP